MTSDRILPAISLPAPGRVPRRAAGHVTTPAARPIAGHRSQPFLTTPARATILVGASAGIYALSLASVAVLQASDDAALAARRQPFLDAIAETGAANDALEVRIAQVNGRTSVLAGAYAGIADDTAAYEARLDELAALVTEVEGSVASLPSRIHLPSVSIRGPIASSGSTRRSAPPRTTTSTRASGG